jgi:AraC family transcriptional regulator of adaptative response / DNA-3-methyladenine glycosylase II
VTAEQVAEAGAGALARVGVPAPVGETISALARAISEGTVRLEPGIEPARLVTALTEGTGVSRQSARTIAARALHWPDAFPSAESALLRVVGVSSERALVKLSDRWRPWRAYAAMHLRLAGGAAQLRISDQRSA